MIKCVKTVDAHKLSVEKEFEDLERFFAIIAPMHHFKQLQLALESCLLYEQFNRFNDYANNVAWPGLQMAGARYDQAHGGAKKNLQIDRQNPVMMPEVCQKMQVKDFVTLELLNHMLSDQKFHTKSMSKLSRQRTSTRDRGSSR